MPKAYLNRPALELIQKERLDVAEKKNADYGGRGDNIEIGGVHGIAIRMLDKAMRLVSLTTPGQDQKVKDESIRDTFLDSGNYSDYGVSLLDGTWGVRPEAKPETVVDPTDMDAWIKDIKTQSGVDANTITMDGVTLPISVLRQFFQNIGAIKKTFPTAIPVDFETQIMSQVPASATTARGKKANRGGGLLLPYPISKDILKKVGSSRKTQPKKSPAPKVKRKFTPSRKRG